MKNFMLKSICLFVFCSYSLGLQNTNNVYMDNKRHNQITSVNSDKNLVTGKPIEYGDIIKVTNCDEYEWCRVENSKYFVRGHLFTKIGNNLILEKNVKTYYFQQKKGGSMFNTYEKVSFETLNPKVVTIKVDTFKIKKINRQPKRTIVSSKVVPSKKKLKVLKRKAKIKTKYVSKKSNYFSTASFGTTDVDIDHTINDSNDLRDGTLNGKGISFDYGIGYNKKNFFFTANFARSILEVVDMTNFYLSANYKIGTYSYQPYIGAIFGYSELVYVNYPRLGTITDNETVNKSGKLMTGLQLGVDKKILKDLSLVLQFQYLDYGHFTSATNVEEKIFHYSQNNLSLGVKYDF